MLRITPSRGSGLRSLVASLRHLLSQLLRYLIQVLGRPLSLDTDYARTLLPMIHHLRDVLVVYDLSLVRSPLCNNPRVACALLLSSARRRDVLREQARSLLAARLPISLDKRDKLEVTASLLLC